VEGLKRLEKVLDPSKRTLEEVRHEWQEEIENQVHTLTTIRRIERMHDEIMSVTILENTSTDSVVYELLTDRLNHINDHIVLYKVVDNEGQCYLSDDGYTLDELKMHGIQISGKTADRIDELLADHYVYRSVWQYTLYTGFCSEDKLGDVVTNFLDAIESIYKEFMG
jgi:domain of unknown function DUF1828